MLVLEKQLSLLSTCLARMKPRFSLQPPINRVQWCMHPHDPIAREVEVGGLEIEDYPQLHSVFQTTLGCVSSYLKSTRFPDLMKTINTFYFRDCDHVWDVNNNKVKWLQRRQSRKVGKSSWQEALRSDSHKTWRKVNS